MRAARTLALRLFAALVCLALLATAPAQSARGLEGLEDEFATARDEYLDLLGQHLPGAYRERFAGLSDDDLVKIAATRRLWQWYIAEGPFTMGDPRKQKTGIFRQEFLDPMDEVAGILLIDPAEIRDGKVRAARAKAFQLAEKLHRAREKAGVEIDPTVGKLAPTGIPYPPLDRPHTSVDLLELFERTLVLAKTVAHPEAEPILMKNAEACAEIDVQEADFAMYANQVRMLAGSITWVVDPLMTACTRDFSNDRVIGKGSGHQSDIPGKRFPRDRANRFGCRSGPEGVGGGPDGRAKVRGFAYNGTGHGGPLFAMLRNVVAPGQRGGAFTAMYQTDRALEHPCAATEGELALPPGVTSRDLGTGALRTAFRALQRGAVAKAWDALDTRMPEDAFERALHRYMVVRVEAEVDWTLTGIERILAAGDAYEAARRLDEAERSMSGMRAFDGRAKSLASRMDRRAVKQEIEIGGAYYRILSAKRPDLLALEKLMEKYPDSAYAEAGRWYFESGKTNQDFWPELFHFVMQDTHLNKWSYLDEARFERR